jgi:uncharacterized protein YndB with AHSA1/START domain
MVHFLRKILVFILFISTFQSVFAQKTINWLKGFEPENAKFFVQNEIEINASAEKVWALLIRAEEWEQYYKGASKVKVPTSDKLLANDVAFTWRTMGLDFISTIKEFVPNERLSWLSEKKQIQGYHVWLIVPTATGCKVITQEAQKGWLTFFEKTFQPNKLRKLHDVWLSELKKKAENKN